MPRPVPSLRVSLLRSDIAVLAALVVAAVAAGSGLSLSLFYPLKAACAFGVVIVLTVLQIDRHHPFPSVGPANQITTIRAALVALVAAAVGEAGTTNLASAVAILAVAITLLDGADGRIARRTHMASAFGARFDMELDAALIQVLALLAWQFDKAGAWILLSGLLRYLFVASGWILPWMQGPLPASARGRAICVIQIVALVLVVSPLTMRPASVWIAAAGLLLLAYSFFVDTRWLWRHARAAG